MSNDWAAPCHNCNAEMILETFIGNYGREIVELKCVACGFVQSAVLDSPVEGWKNVWPECYHKSWSEARDIILRDPNVKFIDKINMSDIRPLDLNVGRVYVVVNDGDIVVRMPLRG